MQYLRDAGAASITIINRSAQRAQSLADRMEAQVAPWSELHERVASADLIVSATGASEPIVSLRDFELIAKRRQEKPLFILDLAVPRDFAHEIARFNDVFLYSVDDLRQACERNLQERKKEWPKAKKIVADETRRFMADLQHRATAPTIQRLTSLSQQIKQDEAARLFNKLPELDERQQNEIRRSLDRLINKLLHPPLDSLRSEAATGASENLIHALRRLFQLGD